MSADSSFPGPGTAVGLESSGDPTAEALIEFLGAVGAGKLRHGAGRNLLEHLVETYHVLRRWRAPTLVQHAALLHSVYGTEAYHQQLVPLARRDELRRLAGARTERLAYLFSVTPRGPLLAGTHTWLRSLPASSGAGETAHVDESQSTRAELDAIVLLHMANMAEQARSRDGSPAPWLARLREVADLLIDSDAIILPTFIAQLASFTEDDEVLARRSYFSGLRAEAVQARESALGLAVAACPVIPEPCVWLAHLARGRNDLAAARAWAHLARQRLDELGTVWDKRLSFDQWRELAAAGGELGEGDPALTASAIDDPRRLYEETLRPPRAPGPRIAAPRNSSGIAERFRRYVESLGEGGSAALGRIYPDLESKPWYDAQEFPLARYLEENFPAIREEILAVDPSGFHRESERIQRSGDWDVAFFYERGRRHDELCEACPVTARGIDAYPAMRTITGLSYLSRMRGGTHIAAHRGPTNLRLRCHLGVHIPDGECAIRVGGETRAWAAGRCLVFDDFFEHEAWNHTNADRLVLIVDLWHPGLSATEIRLLEGLHCYAHAHAHKLGGYWAANAAAASASAGH